MYGQNTERTQLGMLVIRHPDQSYIKYEPTTEITGAVKPVEVPRVVRNLNDIEKLKLKKIKDYIVDQDLELHSKKVNLLEKKLINKNKLEQSLKIKNNALSNTFNEIDKNFIKEESRLLEDYKKLEDKNKEIATIEKMIDDKKAAKAVNKLYRGLFGKTPIAAPSKPKPNIKSIDNKLKEVELIELKDSKPSKVTVSYQPANVKIDERKPWDIKTADSSNTLLTYTPEKFLNYYGDIPFLTIESSIIKTGKDHLLSLKFIFSSRDVSKGYGYINKNDLLKIDFIKSQSIRLYAVDNFSPTLQSYTGYTVYQTQYRFENKSDVKKLTTKHLDKIGVSWSLGYEEYPIYNLEFYF
jgi:hypothetical protein